MKLCKASSTGAGGYCGNHMSQEESAKKRPPFCVCESAVIDAEMLLCGETGLLLSFQVNLNNSNSSWSCIIFRRQPRLRKTTLEWTSHLIHGQWCECKGLYSHILSIPPASQSGSPSIPQHLQQWAEACSFCFAFDVPRAIYRDMCYCVRSIESLTCALQRPQLLQEER